MVLYILFISFADMEPLFSMVDESGMESEAIIKEVCLFDSNDWLLD